MLALQTFKNSPVFWQCIKMQQRKLSPHNSTVLDIRLAALCCSPYSWK